MNKIALTVFVLLVITGTVVGKITHTVNHAITAHTQHDTVASICDEANGTGH